jgi:hypothetical protein
MKARWTAAGLVFAVTADAVHLRSVGRIPGPTQVASGDNVCAHEDCEG